MSSTRKNIKFFQFKHISRNINDLDGLTIYVDRDGTGYFGEEQPEPEIKPEPVYTQNKPAQRKVEQEQEPEMTFKQYIDTLIYKNKKGTLFYKATKKLIKEEIRKGKERGETYDPYANQKSCCVM